MPKLSLPRNLQVSATALGVGLMYFLSFKLSIYLAAINQNMPPIWVASAASLAALVLYGRQYWPAIFVSCLIANYQTGNPLAVATGIAIGNTIEPLVGCFLVTQSLRQNKVLDEQRETFTYAMASAIPTFLSASIGVFSCWLGGMISDVHVADVWTKWWFSNMLGILVFVPTILHVASTRFFANIDMQKVTRCLTVLILSFMFALVVFRTDQGYYFLILSYPLIYVITFLGATEVLLCGISLCVFGTLFTSMGYDVLAIGAPEENLTALQLYMASLALTAMVLSNFKRQQHIRMPTSALAVGWVTTAIVFFSFGKSEYSQDEKHFKILADETIVLVKNRASVYEDALKGGTSFVVSSQKVDPAEWQSYVQTSQIAERHPGIERMGIVHPVQAKNLNTYMQELSALHASPIVARSAQNGERITARNDNEESHFIVSYAEPATKFSLGLDLASHPLVRERAELARDTGDAVFTPKLRLVRSPDAEGFVLLVPYYRTGKMPETVRQRQRELRGWVYGLFLSDKFFRGILSDREQELDTAIFVGDSSAPENLIYRSRNFEVNTFKYIHTENIAHQSFTFAFNKGPLFNYTRSTSGAWILACGSLLALLLGALLASLQSMNQRAEKIAKEKTALLVESDFRYRRLNQDLEQRVAERTKEIKEANSLLQKQESRFRQLADSMPQIVWTTNNAGDMDFINLQWWKYTGISPNEDYNPKTLIASIHPEDQNRVTQAWQTMLSTGKLFEAEFRLKRFDNVYRWHLGRFVSIRDEKGNFIAGYGTSTDIDDQKRVIEELARSEHHFRQLADSMPQIVWTARPDGFFDYYNERWYEFTGFSRPSVGDQAWTSIMPEEDSKRCLEAWYHSVKTGEPYEIEYRFWDRKTHSYLWHLGRALPLKNKKGKITRWVGTCTNIDEKKKAEEALLNYASIIQSSEDAIIAEDLFGNITHWNRAAERIFGYESKDIVKKSSVILFPKDKVYEQMMILENVKDGKTIRHFETEQVRSDGVTFPISISVSPIRNKNGLVSGVAKIVRDVTDEKRISSALKNSEKQLSIVTNNIPGMIYYIGKDQTYRYVNKMCEKWLGMRKTQILGRPARDVLGEREYARIEPHLKTALNGNMVSFEESITSQTGITFHLSSKFVPDISNEGVVLGFIALVLDITEQKLAEEQRSLSAIRERAAIETSQLKSEFLANMSHEVRTPISGVIGMVNLLEKTDLSKEQREYVEAISHSGEILLNVVNDILDFSKIEAGKLQLEQIDFDLRRTVDFLQKTFEPVSREKGIKLRFNGLDAIAGVNLRGDPSRFSQILVNLIGNAIKFTHFGSVTVNVMAKPVDKDHMDLSVEVIDTGIGMTMEQMKGLFSPFTQADGSTSRKYGGSGLGLSISKKLVDMMEGELDVESKKDMGSTFSVHLRLPIAHEEIPKVDPTQNRRDSKHHNLSYANVLIAEDNPINQKIAQKTVQSLGARCTVVANGKEVIHALETQNFHVILMDCQMPEMDGFETTRVIRASGNPRFSHVPIIAITANAMSDDRKKCLETGMNDYIAKPLDANALNQALSRWISSTPNEHKAKETVTPTSLESETLPRQSSSDMLQTFDESALKSLYALESDSNENSEIVVSLIKMFLGNLNSDVTSITQAAKTEDFKKLNAKAHTLKSACAALGVMRMSQICFQLEQMALEPIRLPQILDLIDALGEEKGAVTRALTFYLGLHSRRNDNLLN